MNILVTGATGQLGSKIVKHILDLKKDENLIVSVRNVEKAKDLEDKGVEVRYGDFDDASSLDLAFQGIDRLVIVSTDLDTATRIRQHATAIEAAKRNGVKEIIYTSLSKADNSPLNLAEVHKDSEQRIIASGLDYKIMRNNWYLENEIDTIKQALDTDSIVSSYGEGKFGWMTRDEYALAIAKAALGAGDTNKIYTLSNQLYTIHDLADVLSELTQQKIVVQEIDDVALKTALLETQMPEGVADFVVTLNRGIREGGLDAESNDYHDLTGVDPKPLSVSVKEILAAIQK